MRIYFKYLWYILRHKWFVFLECKKLGFPALGIIHDWSKFRPSEFFPYARYFFRDNSEEGLVAIGIYGLAELAPFGFYTKDHFDIAWFLHQKRNKHHWQWWLLPKDDNRTAIFEIPLKYRKEMLADWRGASRAQGTPDTKKWYLRHKHKMLLGPETRKWIEKNL